MNLNFDLVNKSNKIFFISDTHFGHTHFGSDLDGVENPPIWKIRGFSSCEEMDRTYIDNINENVMENDILFHLGDMALRIDVEKMDSILDSIKCKNIYYLWGNHESAMKKIYNKEISDLGTTFSEVYPLKYKNVSFIGETLNLTIKWGFKKSEKTVIVCSHFPKKIWDYMKNFSWHLHGHCHAGLESSNPENLNEGKILDIGVDNFFGVVEFYNIKKIMDQKKYKAFDQHH
jgi:calcineurin-like phosphoesterase family protein